VLLMLVGSMTVLAIGITVFVLARAGHETQARSPAGSLGTLGTHAKR
jgi:hypothetical protein